MVDFESMYEESERQSEKAPLLDEILDLKDKLAIAKCAIDPMCDLLRMVHEDQWTVRSLGKGGEMRKRFLAAEKALKEK